MASATHVPDGDCAALELVGVPSTDTFKVWSHGYPFPTVRWHFHPEYELHLVTATVGRAFVGDYTGAFAPGNLVLVGPNLPHNWISDVPDGVEVAQRGLVLQFTAGTASGISALCPEMGFMDALLQDAGRGLEFAPATSAAVEPLLTELLQAAGPRRIKLFFRLLSLLHRDAERRPLASVGYRPTPDEYMARPLNAVLAHISRNLGSDLRETDLAALSGYSVGAFSRAFKRHTGMGFVAYVNSLRVNRACEMLAAGQGRVADICFAVGLSNLSNFNRQFPAHKHMPPSAYRGQQLNCAMAATTRQGGTP